MANVLNRLSVLFLRSVHEPDYPVQDWIINPDITAVASLPTRYWKISGDTVSAMSQAEMDAVDAAALTTSRDATATELDEPEALFRAFYMVLLDELNARADKINGVLDAIDASTSFADLKTRIGAIPNYPLRTAGQLRTALRNKLGT